MMRKCPLSLCLATLVSACAVGPDYQLPQLPAAAQAPFASHAPGAVTEPTLKDWWRLYDDPALDSLIAQALMANTDLRTANANLRAAEAVTAEVRNARLPSTEVTSNATYGRYQSPLFLPGSRFTYEGGMNMAYEVDLFGRVSRSIEAARADDEAEKFVRNAVRVRVVASVTDSYAKACASANGITVVRELVALATDNANLVKAQVKAGAAAMLDLQQAESVLAQVRANLAPRESEHEAALFELAALLGKMPVDIPKAASTCASVPTIRHPIPIGDGAMLLRRRPDVSEAERHLAATTARIGVATTDLFPRIQLGASVAQAGGEGISSSQGLVFGAGPLLSFNIPNMGAARARVRQAEAQTQASLAQFDGIVLTALKEVEQALTVYRYELTRKDELNEAQRKAQSATDLAGQSYRNGSTAYLDLIVTQQRLVEIRLAVVQSEENQASDLVDLFRALGGGWETS